MVSDTRCPALTVYLSGGGRAVAPKRTQSCRTQEDFRLFVHPSSLRSEMADLTFDLKQTYGLEKLDLRPKRADLKPKRADLGPDV